jgi:enoyl-[acyl-carrier protein] reductase II
LYPEIDKIMEIIVREGVQIVFTSAGNPGLWTGFLKDRGITVVHVVSSVRFASKAQASGVDAVVAEGFEAGGHNGRDETTTLVLIPMVREAIDIPLLAAGGIATGKAILAVEALGADGAQIGTRFAISEESSAHDAFKQRVAQASEGDTILTLKQLTPVRMIKNKFYERVAEAERRGATQQELNAILGKRRSRLGIFEGDLDEGELEIGQVAGAVGQIRPAADILKDLWNEYSNAKQQLCNGANSD